MDKEALIQYCEMKEEIRDIRERIKKLDKFLSEPYQVSDTVKGTRRDGTIGSIKVTGYPVPEYYRKQALRERYKKLLEQKETELLKLTCQAEEFIEGIPKSEVRIMFRLYDLAYPHKMRMPLGMELKNKGVDIGTIQEIMGHADS